MKHIIFIIILLHFTLSNAWAVREAKPTAIDSRIRIMVYNPNDVFKYTGYYGYQASIEFSKDETIDTISMGDTTAWQVVPSGYRIFIKPIDNEATTNMTVITNKRTYFFEMHAEEPMAINDPDIIFNLKFLYPEEGENSAVQHFASNSEPDLAELDNYNFNYTISGSDLIAPLKIFDDGEFTYFEFKDKNAEIPAFFMVDSNAEESIVNYRVAGRYIVIERVTSQFTLRLGKDITCVFNESRPMKRSI